MAIRVKSRPIPGLDQLDEFWNEFRAVEESRSPQPTEEEHEEKELGGECDQAAEWLKEAGFDEVVKKYRDSKEIDPDDADVREITSSLTRKQAEAVRRRINTLNNNTKQKLGAPLTSPVPASTKYSYTDVRTIFPVQTTGQPSNATSSSTTEHASHTATSQVANVTSPKLIPANSKSTASIVTVTSTATSPRIPLPNSAIRPTLPRRSVSEGLVKPGFGGSDNVGNLGTAGKYSSLAEINGDSYNGEHGKSVVGQHPIAEERKSEDVRLHPAGVQQTKHQHGSVFYVTGLSKQELFNAAEKTKESMVDDVRDSRLNLDDLSISSPSNSTDNESEVIHECPVDVPGYDPSPQIQNGKVHEKRKYSTPNFPKLPNYTLTKDELGVTHISDISKEDMEKVRSLALIELTALFDSHGHSLHRRKPVKLKVKESGIFGVPLQYMVQFDRSKGFHTKVPIFLQEVIGYLEQTGLKDEGILRVPGSVQRVKAIKEEIEETFNEGTFNWTGHRPHDVVSILKQFLRELPFPLLTHEYQPTFAAVERIPDRKQQLQALNLLILLLPSVHRDCLRIVLLFLKHIIANEKYNKMSLNNVAMIMAPNLFLFKSNSDINEIKIAQGTVNVVRMLLKYHNILWTIPGFMVMQVRYLYEAEGNKRIKDAKAVRKLLYKRNREASSGSPQKKYSLTDSTPVDMLEADKANNIIRVKAPMLNKIAMAIQLTKDMTAGDIVDKFKRQPEGSAVQTQLNRRSTAYRNCVNPHGENKFAHDSHYLFEVGGNIGERRLDHDTNMIALHKVNPHAEWIIKPLSPIDYD